MKKNHSAPSVDSKMAGNGVKGYELNIHWIPKITGKMLCAALLYQIMPALVLGSTTESTYVDFTGSASESTLNFIHPTMPSLCPPGKEFCLQTGLCEERCYSISDQGLFTCANNQMFCLITRTCVDIDRGCHDDGSPANQCGENEMLCLSSRLCVHEDGSCPDGISQRAVVMCGPEELFCVSERRCVNDETGCDSHGGTHDLSYHCEDNEMFCLSERRCVNIEKGCDSDDGTHDLSYHCEDNEMFCLSERRCVNIEKGCDSDGGTHDISYQCEDNEMFCLSERRCISVEKGCDSDGGTHDMSYHCEDNEIFCLSERRCVNIEMGCDSDGGEHDLSYHCEYNEMFCLSERRCVNIEEGCDSDGGTHDLSYHCEDNEIFCLSERRCVNIEKGCDSDGGTHDMSYQCEDNEIFCLSERRCVNIEKGCDSDGGTHDMSYQCEDNEIFCLSERRCVNIEKGCDSDGGTHDMSYQCEDNEIFCLSEKRCVNVEKGCDSDGGTHDISYQCEDNEIFCLSERRCVSVEKGCDSDGGTHGISYQCEDNEMFCLSERRCISVEKGCDSDGGTHDMSYHCEDNEIFCLSERRCVNIEMGCDNDGGTRDLSYHCEDNEIFCLSERRCVNVEKGCDNDGGTHGISHQCEDNEIFCLSERRCVNAESGCDQDDGTSDISYQCEEDQMFCLSTKTCTNSDGCTETRGIECPSNQVYCSTTGQCTDGECEQSIMSTGHFDYAKETSTITTIPKHMTETVSNLPMETLHTTQPSHMTGTEDGTKHMTHPIGTDHVTHPMTYPMENEHTTHDVHLITHTSDQSLHMTKTMDDVHTTEQAPRVTKVHTIHTVTMETSTNAFAGHRLFLLEEALSVVDPVLFSIRSLARGVLDNVDSVKLDCGQVTFGAPLYKGKMMVDAGHGIMMDDHLTWTTSGKPDGLITCQITTIPSQVSMGYVYHIGVLALPRILPSPSVTMKTNRTSITEGTSYLHLRSPSQMFHIHYPDHTPVIDSSLEVLTNMSVAMETYKMAVKKMQQIRPIMAHLKFLKRPLDATGLPLAELHKWSDSQQQWTRAPYSGLDMDMSLIRSSVRVGFKDNYSGELRLVFTVKSDTGMDDFVYTIEVMPVNDAPELISPDRLLNTIESMMVLPYNGDREFTVGADITSKLLHDKDGDTQIGLAVLGALSDRAGQWSYHDGTNWTNITVDDTLKHMAANRQKFNVSSLLLSPAHKLKFTPRVSHLWSQREAWAETRLYMLGWDQSNIAHLGNEHMMDIEMRPCGLYKMCGPGGHSPFSSQLIPLYVGKAGCDGIPGSQMEEDICGVCGGHEDCRNCEGTVNGDAKINLCGHCVGGNTGKAMDYGIDCRKHCGMYSTFSIPELGVSMCLPTSTDISSVVSVFLNCDGQFISDAYINSCGFCVLGNTTMMEDHGKDSCGVCHGNNACVDCNGEAYGLSQRDTCGTCLLPTDPSFNTGCQKLGSVNPTIIGANGRHKLRITGAQLASYQTAECRLQDPSNPSMTISLEIGAGDFLADHNTIMAQTETLAAGHAGMYHVFCVFDGNSATELELTEHGVMVFAYPSLDEVIPSQMTINEKPTVTVRGSGFLDTSYLSCAVKCPYIDPSIGCFSNKMVPMGFAHFPATRINDSAVECNLTAMSRVRRAMGYHLTVLLERPSMNNMHSLAFVEFGVLAPAPQLLSAKFSSSYCRMTLTFNMAVEGPTEQLFTSSTLAALGSGAKFMFWGNRLIVMVMRGDLHLMPGHTVTLQEGKIRPKNSHVNYTEYATGSVTVQAPATGLPLEGTLDGPNSGIVGSCDPFTLTLKIGKVGCVMIDYNWTVTVNKSSPTQEILDDAMAVQNRLNSLTTMGRTYHIMEDEILPGATYIFTVTMVRLMDSANEEASVHVTRSLADKPISVQLKMLSLTPDPRQPIRFMAHLTTSNCSGINIQETNFLYDWRGSSADFSVMSFMQFAVVKGGSLRGGATYTMSVTVFVQDDDSISDTASITFTTLSLPLQLLVLPTIQTLPYIATTLTVTGVDPNNMPQAPVYSWSCAKESEPTLPVYVTVNNERRMLEEYVRPTIDTDNTLVIPRNTLPLGRYIWTISMTKDSRSTSALSIMEVVDNRAPLIGLSTIEVTLNSQDPLRIGCKVTSYSKSPVMLYWGCASEETCFDLYQYSDSLMSESSSPVSDLDFSLYLPGNLLTSGQFELQITAMAGEEKLTTTETVIVNVNSPPMIGNVQITPSNGTAFETHFLLEMDEAWIDPEGDTVSFYIHTQKVGTSIKKRLNARGLQDIMSHSILLPAGNFEIYIEACDESLACSVIDSPLLVTVETQVMNEAKMEETASNLADMLKIDMNSAVELAIPLAEIMEDGNGTDKLGEVVNEVAYNFLSSSSAEFDRDQASAILGTAVSILESAAKSGMLEPKVIAEAQNKAYQLAALVLGAANSGNRRRKRFTDNSGGNTVNPMTKEEAETILATYSATFSGQSESDITTSDAQDYLTAVDNIRMGLCAEVTYSEGPTVVESSLETVRVVQRRVDTIATEVIDVTCQNCGGSMPAMITYGSTVQSEFTHWNCSSSEKCYGACLTTSQLSKDLVTATSPHRFSMDMTRRSDIISVKMVNPSTYAIMSVESLSSPVILKIKIAGDVNTTEYSLQCKRWNETFWTVDGCMTSEPQLINDTYHVDCTCFSLGMVSVFEGPLMEATTTVEMTTVTMDTETEVTMEMDMTTTHANNPTTMATDHSTSTNIVVDMSDSTTTSTTVMVNTTSATTTLATTTLASRVSVPKHTDKVYIMFKVHGVYDTVVEADKEGFLIHLRSDLARFMRVAESRINNLKVTKGSIIINFELLSRTRPTELTLGEVVYILLQGVQTGSLPLTDLHGNSLVLDIHSFMWSTNQLEPPSESSSKMIVYIVGAAIGAFVLLVVLTGAFLYIFKVKAGKAHHQVSQSPQPLYGPNMQGVDVPRPGGKPPVIGNWVRSENEAAGSSVGSYSGAIRVQERDDKGTEQSTTETDVPHHNERPITETEAKRNNVVSPLAGTTNEGSRAYPPLTSKAPLPPIGV